MLIEKYNSWKSSFISRKYYCTIDRYPFYNIVAKYLPSDRNAIVVDIGAGDGQFADYLNLNNIYRKLFILDGNMETLNKLKKRYKNVIQYKAPDELPFKNLSINFVHCSHMIEHLYFQELYNLLREIDRILNKNGILVISAPLSWNGFYCDLTHVRPYYPEVFYYYLCGIPHQPSLPNISENYSVLELIYRYMKPEFRYDGLGSNIMVFDFIIQLLKIILSGIGLKNYIKNGYTLILKKEVNT